MPDCEHLDAASLAALVASTCGHGPTLHLGDSRTLGALLAHGIDARGIRTAAGLDASTLHTDRFLDFPPSNVNAATFDTVVASDWIDQTEDEGVLAQLEELRRLSARFVFLVVTSRSRDWWESRSFAAGFRKHPAYYQLLAYEELNQDDAPRIVPLEKIPEPALAEYSLEVLEQNRLLHMDMLREVGRRGDAHCVRYHMATTYVRPGDAVLDLACGYGYGSHLLFQNSQARSVLGIDLSDTAIDYANLNYGLEGRVRFATGNAQSLADVADESIDFIASFETIEHLPDPAAYLDELRRVLRPSGRLMVCAPNDWADETGEDPNPHHLHVYTWDRLRREIAERLLLERGFVQTAGGAQKCHHSPRSWSEVPLESLNEDAEWILLLAMKDPTLASTMPYQETSWQLPTDPEFHVSAFARDYDNPWLVKGLVARGMRFENPPARQDLQDQVIDSNPKDSVDYGAALCGQSHEVLTRASIDDQLYESLQLAIDGYAAHRDPTPHQLRWQVSLLSVGGQLAARIGDREKTQQRFEQCAAIDAAKYSPLLGNKTLDALFELARMRVAAKDLVGARELLLRSVREAHRLLTGSWLNVWGDPDQPLPFGLAELAQLLDKASRAAYANSVLDSALQRPAVFAHEARGYFERILDFKNADLSETHEGRTALATALAASERQIQELAALATTKEQRIQELAAEVIQQDARAQELAALLREKDEQAQSLAAELKEAQESPGSTSALPGWLRSLMGKKN